MHNSSLSSSSPIPAVSRPLKWPKPKPSKDQVKLTRRRVLALLKSYRVSDKSRKSWSNDRTALWVESICYDLTATGIASLVLVDGSSEHTDPRPNALPPSETAAWRRAEKQKISHGIPGPRAESPIASPTSSAACDRAMASSTETDLVDSYFPSIEQSKAATRPVDFPEMAHSMVVGNLGSGMTSERLEAMFRTLSASMPSLTSAEVIEHPITQESMGYAVVRFSRERDVDWAMDNLQGLNAGGQPMNISTSRQGSKIHKSSASTSAGTPPATRPAGRSGSAQGAQSPNSWSGTLSKSSNRRCANHASKPGSRASKDFHEMDWTPPTHIRTPESELWATYNRAMGKLGGAQGSREGLKSSSPDSYFERQTSVHSSGTSAAPSPHGFALSSPGSKLADPVGAAEALETPKSSSPKLANLFFTRTGLRNRRPRPKAIRSQSGDQAPVYKRPITKGAFGQGIEHETGQLDVEAMPEHLDTSPMCPANPKHRSRGTGICPYHGSSRRESL